MGTPAMIINQIREAVNSQLYLRNTNTKYIITVYLLGEITFTYGQEYNIRVQVQTTSKYIEQLRSFKITLVIKTFFTAADLSTFKTRIVCLSKDGITKPYNKHLNYCLGTNKVFDFLPITIKSVHKKEI